MSTDKSGFESLAIIVGATVIIFALEAMTWWIAHRLAWWTFSLAAIGGAIGYQAVKSGLKELRAARRKRRAARLLGERLIATRRATDEQS